MTPTRAKSAMVSKAITNTAPSTRSIRTGALCMASVM